MIRAFFSSPPPSSIADFYCGICLESSNTPTRTLVCYHTFHQHCLDQWLVIHNVCPLCRKVVTLTLSQRIYKRFYSLFQTVVNPTIPDVFEHFSFDMT